MLNTINGSMKDRSPLLKEVSLPAIGIITCYVTAKREDTSASARSGNVTSSLSLSPRRGIKLISKEIVTFVKIILPTLSRGKGKRGRMDVEFTTVVPVTRLKNRSTSPGERRLRHLFLGELFENLPRTVTGPLGSYVEECCRRDLG